MTAHSKAVCSVEFNPDGQTIASGSADGTVKLWSMSDAPKQLQDINITLEPSVLEDKAVPTVPLEIADVQPEITNVSSKIAHVQPEITDVAQLEKLNQKLYDQIDISWRQTPRWYEDLVFQIKVNADNKIINIEPMNQEAIDYIGQTPLPDLLNTANSEVTTQKQPLGIFRVVMTSTGVLKVDPWQGWL